MNVYDIVGGNFYSNAAAFNRETFEKQGAKVYEYKEINVNGYPAKYISMQGDVSTQGYALVFGDTTFSTMIMGIFPLSDAETGEEIINSLNTIWYDKKQKIDPFETANFSVKDKVSKFKFFEYNANIYTYTLNGVDNKPEEDSPMVLISQYPKDNTMTVKSIVASQINAMQKYGLTDPEIKSESNDQINGYDAYEVEITGKMKGKSSLLYYCVVAKKEKAIVIQGIAKKDIENTLTEFKKLAHTVQVK